MVNEWKMTDHSNFWILLLSDMVQWMLMERNGEKLLMEWIVAVEWLGLILLVAPGHWLLYGVKTRKKLSTKIKFLHTCPTGAEIMSYDKVGWKKKNLPILMVGCHIKHKLWINAGIPSLLFFMQC